MPRKARIDAPGSLHHIIFRGIERRKIFRDDTDRNNFVERLGNVLTDTGTPCYAWALIPNHVHLLLKTGNVPIATVMQRILTGHAAYFNRRHKRHGKLFQNRYKSILCQNIGDVGEKLKCLCDQEKFCQSFTNVPKTHTLNTGGGGYSPRCAVDRE